MSRLDELRRMRDFLDAEIAGEVAAEAEAVRSEPAMLHVCALYGIAVEDVLSGARGHTVTRARHAAAWLLHRQGFDCVILGRVLGYSSRSSAWEAVARVERDPAMKALLLGIEVVA